MIIMRLITNDINVKKSLVYDLYIKRNIQKGIEILMEMDMKMLYCQI